MVILGCNSWINVMYYPNFKIKKGWKDRKKCALLFVPYFFWSRSSSIMNAERIDLSQRTSKTLKQINKYNPTKPHGQTVDVSSTSPTYPLSILARSPCAGCWQLWHTHLKLCCLICCSLTPSSEDTWVQMRLVSSLPPIKASTDAASILAHVLLAVC